MVQYIDDHGDRFGVEPICRQLQIAPSTYYEHKARQVDPSRLPARAQRGIELYPRFIVCGTRTSVRMARCTGTSSLSKALYSFHQRSPFP